MMLFSLLPASRPPVTGTVIWYRANGLFTGVNNAAGNVDGDGNVLQWNDLSTNGNHAIQGSVTDAPQLRSIESIGFNQRKALNFNGQNTELSISNLTLTKNISGFTMFAVCRSYGLRDNGNVNEVVYFGTEDANKGRCSLIIIYGATPSWMMRARRVVADGPSFVTGSSDITEDTVLSGVVNYQSGYGAIYENATLVDSDNAMVTTGSTSNLNSADSTVGNLEASGLFYPFLGEISEIICVNRALNDSEIVGVSNFLSSFYGAPCVKTAYDPIVYAFLARCQDLPEGSFITALNNFISSCRLKGNIPRSMFCFKCSSSQQALIDIIRPQRNAIIPVGSPTFTPGVGYTMTGSNYLRTGIILSSDGLATQNSIVMGIRNTQNAVNPGVDFGCFDGTRYVKHYIKWTDGNSYFRINSATPNNVANSDPTGFSTLIRRTANNNALSQRGTILSNPVAISNGLSTREIFIGAFNNNGVASEFSQSRTYDMFYFDDGSINVPEFEADAEVFLSQI